ncbi:hypothetical protein B0H14DRAFT_3527583 [Mycena olivaceomarginata]|nr:hypothetical protein B0H14DRAFT_3527583 [Mycena olivaceomarginata]
MGTAWGCAHGCEAAASLPASGGTSCAFPTHFLRATERGPTPLRRERARTFCPPPTRSAVPVAVAGSTSLPAPACRPTPALEQGGGVCGNGIGRRASQSGARSPPLPHGAHSPLEQGSGAGGGGREGGIPVAGGASPRGLGLTLWWAQAARAHPASPHRSARPPACPPALLRANP